MEAVKFMNYSFAYKNSADKILDDVSFTVKQGDFVLLCGQTGSGKTTLLKCTKKEISPFGNTQGEINILGKEKNSANPLTVGFVSQNPENQLVMENVWQEMAFGLENMGLENAVIKRRIGETASFFGIENLLKKKTNQLSGGQMQTVNLACIMAMQPKIIVLDEPCAQLDPIAAKDFLQLLSRINKELGTTVIMSEHNLEDSLCLADMVLYVKNKGVQSFNTQQFINYICTKEEQLKKALPYPTQTAIILGELSNFPVTVSQGKRWLENFSGTLKVKKYKNISQAETLLEAKGLWYRYNKEDFAIKNVSAKFYKNKITAIVGGNGGGKSTLLHLLCGVYKPQRGHIKQKKNLKISLLSQNPKSIFSADTVEEELILLQKDYSYTNNEIEYNVKRFGLEKLLHQHPYDLSGGEMQKLALAKQLLLKPNVLMLDEPTKGMDSKLKEDFIRIIKEEQKNGSTIILVTHDLELAARTADDCIMLQNGEVVCCDNGKQFFSQNLFYTTSVNRILRDTLPNCIVLEDLIYEQ